MIIFIYVYLMYLGKKKKLLEVNTMKLWSQWQFLMETKFSIKCSDEMINWNKEEILKIFMLSDLALVSQNF